MPSFEFSGKIAMKNPDVSIPDIIGALRTKIQTHYTEDKISIDDNSKIIVNGNLDGFFERANTLAHINIHIDENYIKYHVSGKSEIGYSPFILLVGGLAIGALGFHHLEGIMISVALIDAVAYVFSRDRPKRYLMEDLQALEFEFGA
jgi:hypothetical protein